MKLQADGSMVQAASIYKGVLAVIPKQIMVCACVRETHTHLAHEISLVSFLLLYVYASLSISVPGAARSDLPGRRKIYTGNQVPQGRRRCQRESCVCLYFLV